MDSHPFKYTYIYTVHAHIRTYRTYIHIYILQNIKHFLVLHPNRTVRWTVQLRCAWDSARKTCSTPAGSATTMPPFKVLHRMYVCVYYLTPVACMLCTNTECVYVRCMYVCIFMSICMNVCIFIRIYVCMYVWLLLLMFVCMYVCMYVEFSI